MNVIRTLLLVPGVKFAQTTLVDICALKISNTRADMMHIVAANLLLVFQLKTLKKVMIACANLDISEMETINWTRKMKTNPDLSKVQRKGLFLLVIFPRRI